jgi:hypothetical protein
MRKINPHKVLVTKSQNWLYPHRMLLISTYLFPIFALKHLIRIPSDSTWIKGTYEVNS